MTGLLIGLGFIIVFGVGVVAGMGIKAMQVQRRQELERAHDDGEYEYRQRLMYNDRTRGPLDPPNRY